MEIHFSGNNDRTACGKWAGMVYEFSPDWTKVTCGPCRLEMPPTNVPGQTEYRTPEHVRAVDASLAEQDMLRRRVAKLDAVERMAVDVAAHWARTLREAVELKAEARALLTRVEALNTPGVGQGRVGAQKLSRDAQSALLATPGGQTGAAVPDSACRGFAGQELYQAGMMSSAHNLTRLGSITRDRLLSLAEDEAFGS